MRKIFAYIVVFILFAYNQITVAQPFSIVNNFENWTDGVNPEGWTASFVINIDMGIIPIPINMNFGSRNSTSPCQGSYDLQISPYHFGGLGSTLPSFTIPGIAQLGANRPISVPLSTITDLINNGADLSDPEALASLGAQFAGLSSSGIPIQGNITAMQATVRFLPAQEGDTATIFLFSTRWNNELQIKEGVASGYYVITDEIPECTQINIPITVLEETLTADSLMIVITVGGASANPESKFFVDNIILNGVVGINENAAQYAIYPNPVSDIINIIPENNLPYSVKLFDLVGKLILERSQLKSNENLNVGTLTKGIYLLEFTQGNEKCVKKIIIQ